MRPERLYLQDIVDAAAAIARFVSGFEREEFLDDDLVASAVLQKLSNIGEAASRLSSEFKSNHPEIEWRRIVAFRNIVIHAYFSVDLDIVWEAATLDAPQLSTQVWEIIRREYPTA